MKYTLILFLLLITGYSEAVEPSVENPGDNQAQIILAELRDDLTSLEADFIQFELSPDGRVAEENSGMVWMQAPDYFKWHYQEPFEQLIVADGEKVWVYDEDLQQVTVKSQKNNLNPIYVIINEDLSGRYYDLAYEGQKDGLSWVRLTPKETSNEVKSVMLGIEANQLHSIRVNNQLDQTLVFEFSNVKRNPEMADNTFKFRPPEGVDVVEAID